jgi:hypothetical protein
MSDEETPPVRAITTKALTPIVLFQTLIKRVHELDQVYAVVRNKDGTFEMYSTHDLSGIPSASAMMQHMAMAQVLGRIDDE